MKDLSWQRALFWLLLVIPAGLMVHRFTSGDVLAMQLYHPTGEMALRLMLLAMLVGPLTDVFGTNRFLRTWLSVRRNLGVAAFCYAGLHLVFYFIDMGALVHILDEMTLPAIWTGWLSFAFLLGAASISTDSAVRRLGRHWKRIQRGVYAAFLLACVHWWLLDRNAGPALVHLSPLLVVWSLRLALRFRRSNRKKDTFA